MPKVSVIIPAYNQAQYLDDALQSVFSQTFQDYEVIVVNDGSTDDTAEVARRYVDRIRYICQENRGLAGARNTGIRAAQGEFIGLLDSDDLWQADYLEKILSLAERHPRAAVYFCQAQCMDTAGHDLPQLVGFHSQLSKDIYHTILRANFLIPSTIMMRRSVVVEAGLFDQELRSLEDTDLWLRLLPDGCFIGTPDVLVRYRVHPQSLSANPTGMQKAYRQVIEKNFGPDDSQYDQWSPEKRRAYGGLYRYYVISSVQRQDNWDQAGWLRKAFMADPTLSEDLDMFYDLALGNQPVGFRVSSQKINVERNGGLLANLLGKVFNSFDSELKQIRSKTYATVYKAMGMVAYNTGNLSISRRYFIMSLRYNPSFKWDKVIIGSLLKSWMGERILNTARIARKVIMKRISN